MLLPNKKFKNQNSCVHPFCTDCIIKYIAVKLEENIGDIPCPSLNCNQFFDPISCRNLVGRQLFVKWSDVLCESSVLRLAKCYCPNRNCSALILDECGGGNAKRSRCPNCKRLFCFKCKLPWHAGLRCDGKDINDVAFHVLAMRKKWKRCPMCRHFVERNQGVTAISITNAEDELIITFVIVNLGTNYGHVGDATIEVTEEKNIYPFEKGWNGDLW
ncbi:hypothetical protein HAX54_009328 [Datura stramonium]|uniref:RBR-type E3 ubiquitin transferase n=1 Tax=Datura stramonium TaxID=4076 RepID=A0ABS8TEM4_DATST|nr:hypothetical protein [Datura stramonium]